MSFPHLWRMNPQAGLIPIIRPVAGEASLELIPGGLSVGLGIERGDSVELVDQAKLEEWGTSVEALMPFAVENLRRRSSLGDWEPIDSVPELSLYVAEDGQAASRMLLLEDLLQRWPSEGVLVSVPANDQLLVVPLHGLESLEAFHVLVMAGHLSYGASVDALSDQVFWFDGQEWHAIAVRYDEEVRLDPPPAFLQALERLAAVNFMGVAAEA